MKKIAIIAVVVIIAIFAFFYVQIQRLETVVSTKLAQHETTFQQFNLGFFPQPSISFDKVRHNQISVEKLTGKFPLSALFSGNVQLQALDIQNLKLSENAQNAANIQMRFSDFSLDNISGDGIVFNGENQIDVELAKPLYGNNRTFNFRFLKGGIRRSGERKFSMSLAQAELNQQPLGSIQADFDLSRYVKLVTADLQSDCPQNCFAHIDYQSEPEQSAVVFSGKNYPIEQIATLFNFPRTITGATDFEISMKFAHSQVVEGKFHFNARNGELLGLNLLELVGQYLPLNWDADELQNRDGMNTRYQEVVSDFSLNGHRLDIEKMTLKTTALFGEGRGRVDLQSMQCDIRLNLSVTNEKYAEFALPIRFFDSCYSPQYEVQFDKDFRNKIRELIRRKLKQ